MLRITTTGFALTACSLAVAQIASDGSLPGKNKFDTVEVLSKQPSDGELRRRSLVAKKIFGRDELDRFGDANLADVLSNLPGVQIVNGLPAMSGMDPKYTKILFNGDPAPPGVMMDQISPSLIERVEITRGQVANQSGQSIGGTINIVFKDRPQQSQANLRYGAAYQNERPTPFLTYTVSGKSGDLAFNIPISVQELRQTYQVHSGKHFIESNGVGSVGYQERHWFYGLQAASVNPSITYTIDDDQKVTAALFAQVAGRDLLHQYERRIIVGNPVLDDDFQSGTLARTAKLDLGWTRNLGDAQRLEAKASVTGVFAGACWVTYRPAEPISEACNEKRTGVSRLSGSYQQLIDDRHAVTLGFDINTRKETQWERSFYKGTLSNPLGAARDFVGRVDNNAAYIQDEWQLTPAFGANLGLRAESISLSTEAPAELASNLNTVSSTSNTHFIINPIIHAIYRPGKQAFRASLSRGFKAPDVWQLGLTPGLRIKDVLSKNSSITPDTNGNNQLRPEIATGLDVSYETPMGSGTFAVAAFYRDVDDIITNVTSLQNVYYSPTPRWVSQPINFAHGKSYGVEFELKGPASAILPETIAPKKPLNLRLSANLYGSQIDDLPGPNNRFESQYPWTVTLGFDYKHSDAWSFGASYFASPSFTRLVSTSEQNKQSDLRWINAFATCKIDSKSLLRIGLNNVFPSTNGTEYLNDSADVRVNRMGRTGLTVTIETKL